MRAPPDQQNPTYPFVTFFKVTEVREHAMVVEPGLVAARIQGSAFGKTYKSAKQVAEQMRAALERWSGVTAGVDVMDTFIEDENDLYEDDVTHLDGTRGVFHTAVDATVHYRE